MNVSFQEKDSGVPMQTTTQDGGIVQPKAKQKVVAKKNASLPSKRRKVPVLDEKEFDNTFIESVKSSVPSKVKITYPADVSYEEEEEE